MAAGWTGFEERDGKRFRTYKDAGGNFSLPGSVSGLRRVGNTIVYQLNHENGPHCDLEWVIIGKKVADELIRNTILSQLRPEESSVPSAHRIRTPAANRGRHPQQLASRERSDRPVRRSYEHSRDDSRKPQQVKTPDDADFSNQYLANYAAESRTMHTYRRTIEIPATELTDFTVQHAQFFAKGRVFRAIWPEPLGVSLEDQKRDTFEIYIELRPMVVIHPGPAHCICVPIYSYGGKGTTKDGLKEAEIKCHAIAYSSHRKPTLMAGEKENGDLMLKPFPVDTVEGVTLQAASRVRFDMPQTVSYNIRVRVMGRVRQDHRQRLLQSYKMCFGDTGLASNPQKENQDPSTPRRGPNKS